jgi:hypothetical protein
MNVAENHGLIRQLLIVCISFFFNSISFYFLEFEMDVEQRLYGQHIAQKMVITAVRAHITKP